MAQQSNQIKGATNILFQHFQTVRQNQYLDPQQLSLFKKQQLKPLYMTKIDQDRQLRKYFCFEACCQHTPGSFFCCNTSLPDSKFTSLGVGMCYYFKFLKHGACFYSFMSVLAIIACLVCFAVASQNGFNTVQNYSVFLFSSSLGVFSSEHNKCQYGLIDRTTRQAKINVQCPNGKIKRYGTVFSNQSLNSPFNCRNQMKKRKANQISSSTAAALVVQSCNSQNNKCDIAIQLTTLPQYRLIAYTYECFDNRYSVGSIQTDSDSYFFFVVAIDIIICISFIVFLCSQVTAQEKQQKYFKRNQVSLNDFTVRIKGFLRKDAYKQFRNLMKIMQFSQNNDRVVQSIVAATFPECDEMVQHFEKQGETYIQMEKLIDQYFFFGQYHSFGNFQTMYSELQSNQTRYQEYKGKLNKIVQKFTSQSLSRTRINAESTQTIDLYLVFNNIKGKEKILKMQTDNFCYGKSIRIHEKQYTIRQPPSPDMIQWDNRVSWTWLRMLVFWILTLAICLGSYLLFGYIQFKQNELFQNYNYGIDCKVLFPAQKLATLDPQLIKSDDNYQTCICKQKGFLGAFSDQNCSDWQKKYYLYIAVPLLISLGLVIYNVIISYLFKLFSRCQRHKFVAHQDLSFTFKRAFLLIMNMGLLMILLNLNYTDSTVLQQISFLFLGRYDDFTADWYLYVGGVIILTLIFNIAFPIVEIFIALGLKCVKYLWDSRCCRVPTSRPTKQAYVKLYSDDLFAIGERYAYLMATFFVSFVFSGVLPILVPIMFISLFLLYFSDKFLIFKFFQKPLNYDAFLHRIFIKILYISLMAHFGLTAFFLSEPTMIAERSFMQKDIQFVNSDNLRIKTIMTNYVTLIYVLLLALMILYVILNHICCNCLNWLRSKCKKRQQTAEQRYLQQNQENVDLLGRLSSAQVKTLLKITNYQRDTMLLKNIVVQSLARFMNVDMASSSKHIEGKAEIDILDNTISQLQSRQNQANSGQASKPQFVGLPSYDYVIKSSKFSRNQQMIDLEENISAYLRKLVSNNQIRLSQEKGEKKGVPDSSSNLIRQDVF